MTKIKVLHVVTAMDMGGIESTLMNYMRNIDRSKIQFDFLVHRSHEGFFDSEIRQLGGLIHIAPKFSIQSLFSYIKHLKSILKEYDYDIMHSHLDALSFIPLLFAKKSGIKVRIAHSHVNGFDKNFKYPLRMILKRFIPLTATSYLSCSESAGVFMFPNKDFQVLLNPVSIEQFSFDSKKRNKVRDNLGITDELVVGHIGRFDLAKNHKFIVDLAEKVDEKIIFILVGGGSLLSEIKETVVNKGLNNIIFVGITVNAYEYYSAFDVFILPSLYEGLGIVAIEAQVNGLPVLLSDKVSSEVVYSDNVCMLPLTLSAWKERLLGDNLSRSNQINQSLIRYDIEFNINFLLDLYIRLLGNVHL